MGWRLRRSKSSVTRRSYRDTGIIAIPESDTPIRFWLANDHALINALVMAIERKRSFRAPLTDQELAMLHALSDRDGVSAATFVRTFIRREYTKHFGATKPGKKTRT